MLSSAPVPHQESATTDAPAPVSSDALRPEYARPRLRRERWTNLNGTWRFAFDDDDRGLRERWWQVPARSGLKG